MPSSQVDMMQTPGAAMSIAGPKLEKSASVSSSSSMQEGDTRPPGFPSPSAMADGDDVGAYRRPGLRCGDRIVSGRCDVPTSRHRVGDRLIEHIYNYEDKTASITNPRLRLATSMDAALAVTSSIPNNRSDTKPSPLASRTRTDHSQAPGATPVIPAPSRWAAAMPAGRGSHARSSPRRLPSGSHTTPPRQSTILTTFRSGWGELIPVSMMAISTSTGDADVLRSASIRSMPVVGFGRVDGAGMDLEVGEHVGHRRMLCQIVRLVGRDIGSKTSECMAVNVDDVAPWDKSARHPLGCDRRRRVEKARRHAARR